MSVYRNDKAEFLREALESIVNQTVPPKEIILVIDGPILKEVDSVLQDFALKTSLLRIVKFPVNKGLGLALKAAVEVASTDLIARMDSDDISLPDRRARRTAPWRCS